MECGLVRKVVVYKLDRISRSILDFAKMMDFFQKYEVEFVSSTEKFDTSTPMGRAMLNICVSCSPSLNGKRYRSGCRTHGTPAVSGASKWAAKRPTDFGQSLM